MERLQVLDSSDWSESSVMKSCTHWFAELACQSRSATVAITLGLAALSLNGCGLVPGNGDERVNTVVNEPPPMDTILLSDLLRFYLDGETEMVRGHVDCYGNACVNSDGDRTLLSLPRQFVFAGHHHDYITADEETIENRNGIMIGDVAHNHKNMPDTEGASNQSYTGYGGWGQYHGFDVLYFDFLRKGRQQRLVWGTLGGYRSEGTPTQGTLTWTGAAVGIDYSVIKEDRVLKGDSRLVVELDDYWGAFAHVVISDLTDISTGKAYPDMVFRNNLLSDGGFENRYIRAQFFGPNHEEVAGMFERDQIIGAFGASR